MDIGEMVTKAKRGDQDALVQLISAKRQDYYKLAYVFMKNREDALDALEDMILVLYEKLKTLKKEEAFYSWSKTILVNRCKTFLIKKKKVVSLDLVPEEACEANLRQKDDQILLDMHLSRLKQEYQDVLKLRYFLDYDYHTISDIMKIPVGTVKSRISTGLKKMKESLGGEV